MAVNYTVTSDKVVLRPLDIKFDFTFLHLTASTTGAAYQMCDLGKFKYDFDLVTDIDDVDKIGIRAGAITASFFDNNDAEYPSVYEAIFSSGVIPQHIDANISIYNPSGAVTPDIIKCRFNHKDVSYDINARKTTITFNPLRPSDVTDSIEDIISETSQNVYTNSLVSLTLSALVARDFIDDMLDKIYGSTGSNLIISNLSDTDPSFGEDVWFVFDEKQDTEELLTASEQLANIAGVEGSVFGNMLGQKVYFARNLDGGETVAMSESDFKDLKLETTARNKYRQLSVIHGDYTVSSTLSILDENASKTANFSFKRGNLGKRDVAGDGPIIYSFGSDDLTDNTLAEFGVDSYETLLLEEHTPKISGTIFGCNTIKPYECMSISFGTAKTSRLIGSLDGTYRFSSVTYDLEKDLISFKAYKI